MSSRGVLVVTGASGFVGRHLVTTAASSGWQVRALARDPARVPTAANIEAIDWDVADARSRPELLEDAVVCHLAAMIPPDFNDPAHAESLHRVNALGTLDILRAARAGGSRHLIYTSSGNAYAPCDGLAKEDGAVFPAARAPYYLSSKLAGEVFVEHFRVTRRLPTTILRLSSVYGPGMPTRDLIANFTEELGRGDSLSLRNGGLHRADFVCVDDVVQAILKVAEGRIGGIFNIGSGHPSTAREVAEILVDLLGAKPKMIVLEPENGSAAPGSTGLDVDRARKAFGYIPRELRSGLEDYIASLSR
jgi:UDP-glucose 4-epimerase